MTQHEFTCAWVDHDMLGPLFGQNESVVTMQPETVTVCGIDFYAFTWRCLCRTSYADFPTVTFEPLEAATVIQSEWWRRVGFHILKYTVRAWRRVWLVLLVAMLAAACGQPAVSSAKAGAGITVDLLFEHEGVRVYRFLDYGKAHYYAVPRSGATAYAFDTRTERCGKNCTSVVVNELPTVEAATR